MKVVYCQLTYKKDFEKTKECIQRVSPYVDATIIVYDETLSTDQIRWLEENSRKYNLYLVFKKFNDNLPEMRNAYLEKAKEIGADWVCVSDPDELYSEELAKNLKTLIATYSAQGFNLLAVPARDQFDNVEWLDDLDLLKEVPGGYRETDYWKPMLIFKLYPDTHYEGVGVEGKIHERIVSSIPWKSVNLPKQYFYVHKKSALRIWRNAMRNMFIAGGGDNVGALNRYWVKLRQICSKRGINTWYEFEKFIEQGTEDPEFHEWLKEALQAPPTNWGIETRETAKYYFALHKDQITPEIESLIKTKPKMTPEIEVEQYITSMYFKILGRHPDAEGLKTYKELILSGIIKKEELPKMLMTSEEYRSKFAQAPPKMLITDEEYKSKFAQTQEVRQLKAAQPKEAVKVQVPVDVNIMLTEDTIIEAIFKSKTYWNIVKPKLDIGSFILNSLSDIKKKIFISMFYTKKLSIEEMFEWIIKNKIKPDSIAVCIMGYHKGINLILETLERLKCYASIDEIHVQGDDFTERDIELLESYGAKVHIVPWEDNFSDYKNKAISYANTEWVLVLDHDEIPTKEMLENLKRIIKESQRGTKYNIVSFDVIDVIVDNGKVVSRVRSQSGKPLLHWNVPEPYYGNPHIWLKPNYYPWKQIHVPYAYEHIKEKSSILANSVRNIFLGGGGDNVREGNPLWVELRRLTKELGVDTWKSFHEYLKRGNIDKRILNVFKRMSEMPWKDDELKDPLKYYLQLHPEEKERLR